METISAVVLDDDDANHRKSLLGGPSIALANAGIRSVPISHHRLVLRYADPPPLLPSGPTNPELRVFVVPGSRSTVVTTDGEHFRLDSGQQYPVADLKAAVTAIRGPLRARSLIS